MSPSQCGQILYSPLLETDTASFSGFMAQESGGVEQDGRCVVDV